MPAACSTRRSSSTNGTRRRRASRRPMVVLPAPRSPSSATTGRALPPSGGASSAAGVRPRARARPASFRTEMLALPASSSMRKREDSPARVASSSRVQPWRARSARTRRPISVSSRSVSIALRNIMRLCGRCNVLYCLTVGSAAVILGPMEHLETATPAPVRFDTHPSRYVHWNLEIEPPLARLSMDVVEERGLRPGYPLKLNSYDLGVDLELADAIQRLRFEHPEVRVVVIGSAKDRVFCSGANIYMLGSSTHAFKVNFCKYTNETRLALEDASANSGLKSLAAVNGACAGGGYELALACDEILLVDDASSAVSLPEVPLLAVLPGTGGLTRLVDKRKVRRDLADVFASLGEGVKGKRAVQWDLVDEAAPLSRFPARVAERAKALASSAPPRPGPGVELRPLEPRYRDDGIDYRHVTLDVDAG